MALPQLKLDVQYSYSDFLTWDEGRWELIGGEVWDMTPAPSMAHQQLSMILGSLLYHALKDRGCEVFAAPFDVRLTDNEKAEDYEIYTVVQPDISIICDKSKLDKRGCVGAPDVVVEILSPSTAAKDLKVKRELYQKHGVKEYWLAHPTDRIMMIYVLDDDGKYNKAQIYDLKDTLRTGLFEGFEIKLSEVFPEQE